MCVWYVCEIWRVRHVCLYMCDMSLKFGIASVWEKGLKSDVCDMCVTCVW